MKKILYIFFFLCLVFVLPAFIGAANGTHADIKPGSLVKNKNNSQVFYIDSNRQLRWVANEQAAAKNFGPTWNQSIIQVDNLSSAGLSYGAQITTADTVVARTNTVISDITPGKLVKNKKYAEVFFVDRDRQLRWVVNETVARKNFGPTWNQTIVEVNDISTTGMTYGNQITINDQVDTSLATVSSPVAAVSSASSAPAPAPVIPPIAPIIPIIVATTTPQPATPPVSNSSLEWGVFAGGSSASNLSSFEQLVGKQANMQAIFVGWNDSFPSSLASNLKANNKKLIIFWEQYGVTLDAISAGNADSYIAQFAQAAKSSGASIILAPLHEMNGNWDPWDGTMGNNTPAKVIAAWKRIHDGFTSATNVKFAWAVNNVSVPDTAANAIGVYYPGDAYVDYVAVDGFNFANPWQTWDQVFPASLMNKLAAYNKPVYIISTASEAGAQKAQWIKDMGTGIKKYPSVAGWVWFNLGGSPNWLVNSDTAALSAFKSILP